MASKYTYDDFRRAAAAAGLAHSFSDADTRLAQSNPDAGMSLLKYKQDYTNAKTDEARALAHMGAENIRSSYGNYSGGGDGGSFYLNQPSPADYTAPSAPTYESRYTGETEELLDRLLQNEPFSYNAQSDPVWQQYQKTYNREGRRAVEDTMGAYAAQTGGLPSSYAVTAAAQAGSNYAAQLSDKLPELYEAAYNRYLNEYNKNLTNLSAVQNAEQIDYSKYLDELNQYNTDRGFGYEQHLSEIDSQAQERAKEIEMAVLAAQYGDTAGLEKLGVSTQNNPADYERQYTLAQLAAQYGDFSGLKRLGIQPDAGSLYRFSAASSGGSQSGGSSSSGSSSSQNDGSALGVIDTMLSLGNDAYAYEYLVGQGYGSEATKNLYKMYQQAKKEQQAAQAAAEIADDSGVVTSQQDWDALVDLYGEDTLKAMGYSLNLGADSAASDSALDDSALDDINQASILALGLGPISYSRLEELVETGDVITYTQNGELSVRWKDKDARKRHVSE